MMSTPYPVPRTPYSEKGQPERSEVLQASAASRDTGGVRC